MNKILSLGLIIFGSVVLTTLAIDAADTLSGSNDTLLARVLPQAKEVCPEGMIEFKGALTFSCVDIYEAAPGADCSITSPQNQFQTEVNIKEKGCEPVSEASLIPWTYVSREQARALCTKAGKRLPTGAEWYGLAIGTDVENCVINNQDSVTGEKQTSCISAGGVVGAVGNVWEWVDGDVIDGHLEGVLLPSTGYITDTNKDGLAIMTTATKGEGGSMGYFWSELTGHFGVIKGGFYGSKRDASVYTMHAHTDPKFVGAAVGFRCVR